MRRLVLLATTFVLAAFAVGVSALTPAAQGADEACPSGEDSIPATSLPQTIDLDNCPIGGKEITDHGVGTVLPDPGQSVYVESMTEDGSQELAVTRRRDDTVELDHVGDESEDAQVRSNAVTAARSGECSDDAYDDLNHRVTVGLGYSFNRSTTPHELTRDAAEGAIRTGGTNITSTRNNCGLEDGVPAELTYLGDTDSTANVEGNICGSDGSNVLSFGDLPGRTLATTCTWSTPSPDYEEVTESDIKINKTDFKWTAKVGRSCRNKYDLQSVMTHEWGHTFGLGHVPEDAHGELTMSPLIGACQKSPRTLDKGDVLGLNNKYL